MRYDVVFGILEGFETRTARDREADGWVRNEEKVKLNGFPLVFERRMRYDHENAQTMIEGGNSTGACQLQA